MIHTVPLFPQSQSMSCWAASIAMILGWKHQQSIADVTIATNNGGPSYVPSMQSGLDPNDRYMLETNGFQLDEPQCYMRSAIEERLSRHGPLWVASAMPSAHIRVLCGIKNDRLHINDPWPVNQGSKYTRSFDQFFGRMETLGAQESSEPAPIYVAYLRETI